MSAAKTIHKSSPKQKKINVQLNQPIGTGSLLSGPTSSLPPFPSYFVTRKSNIRPKSGTLSRILSYIKSQKNSPDFKMLPHYLIERNAIYARPSVLRASYIFILFRNLFIESYKELPLRLAGLYKLNNKSPGIFPPFNCQYGARNAEVCGSFHSYFDSSPPVQLPKHICSLNESWNFCLNKLLALFQRRKLNAFCLLAKRANPLSNESPCYAGYIVAGRKPTG